MEPIYPNSQDNCKNSCDEFDSKYSTRSIRMLKLLTPLLPSRSQPMIAILIRFQELQITIRMIHNEFPAGLRSMLHAAGACSNSSFGHREPASDPAESVKQILQRISPLLYPDEKKEIDKITQLFQMLETYKQLEPYMSMFMQAASDSSDNESGSSGDCDSGGPFNRESSGSHHSSDSASPFSGFSIDQLMGGINPEMIQNISSLFHAFSSDSSAETNTDPEKTDFAKTNPEKTDPAKTDS